MEGTLSADPAAPAVLPADACLLPLSRGELLVSRARATFCRVPAAHATAVRQALRAPAALPPDVHADLERHGFFAPPRPAKPDPPSVQLQLTNACNLACQYCCTNSGRARGCEVSQARLRQVVREIPEAMGADTGVALLGGEPLLVPWATDLGEDILDGGLRLTLFTNGLPLADADVARRVAHLAGRGAEVRVSLAGPESAVCDALAGTPRFATALAGLRQLEAHGARAIVDLMFAPQTAAAIAAELPALRRRLPANTRLTFGVLYHSGREAGAHLFPSRAALEAALDRIAFEAGELVPATGSAPLAFRREGCPCALGQHVHVRSDGALFNCFKMEERIGDLATTGFRAAAEQTRANPRRATALPVCRACPLATLCGGGCRSENLLYTGDGDTPPCGPWRVRVLSELLADDHVAAVEWPVAFLLAEARQRGLEAPADLVPRFPSRHLLET